MPINIKLPKKEEFKDVSEILPANEGKIINSITFFGDSAIEENDTRYQEVWDCAKLLAENGFSIVNGGGPGIMKASTDGAKSVNGKTKAVFWEPKLASFFEGKNLSNITDSWSADSNYVMRTLGLIEQGDAYVVCIGGTGTISEFGLVWCLAKLYYGCHKPVILFGDFWVDLISNIQNNMLIDEKEYSVLYFASTKEEILEILAEHELKIKHCKIQPAKHGDEKAFVLGSKVDTDVTVKSYNLHASNYHSKIYRHFPSKDQLDEFCNFVNSPAMVLDVGAGSGIDAGYLSEKYSVKAIEPSDNMARIAKFENPNVDVINQGILEYDLEENFYKGVWARDSIHHIKKDNLPLVFEKIYNSLVDSGIFYLIVREGNDEELLETENKSFGQMQRYYFLFSENYLKNLAKSVGFEKIKIEKIKKSHAWLSAVFRK